MTKENLIDKFDVVLNMDDKNFTSDFMDAIGAKDGDVINIVTPQFERDDGLNIKYVPKTIKEFDDLKQKTDIELQAIGLQCWDDKHWLYPGEWYSSIPEGYPLVDIFGETKFFSKETTDSDIRFGALAYGFIKP